MIDQLKSANYNYPFVASSNTYIERSNRDMFNVFGIYLIQNIENNKFYIGSSCDLLGRIRGHFNHKKGSIFNKQIFRKEFASKQLPVFNVCAVLHLPSDIMDLHLLREIEVYMVSVLNPQYNKIKPHHHSLYVKGELLEFIDSKIAQLKTSLTL